MSDQNRKSGSDKSKRKSKKQLNLLKLARESLEVKLDSLVDGRHISTQELGVINLVNCFAKTGDPKIYKMLVDVTHKSDGPEVIYSQPSADVSKLSDDELYEAFISWAQPLLSEPDEELE